MCLQSLDLNLDADGDAAMRAGWMALGEIGVRSEGQRTSTSHRPHVTALAVAQMAPPLLERATDDFSRLLPLQLPVGAAVVFGAGPYVVAHLVIAPLRLCHAVAGLRALSDAPGLPWVPHLTLARKVQTAQVGEALAAAAHSRPDFVVVDSLRHWDPNSRTVTTLV